MAGSCCTRAQRRGATCPGRARHRGGRSGRDGASRTNPGQVGPRRGIGLVLGIPTGVTTMVWSPGLGTRRVAARIAGFAARAGRDRIVVAGRLPTRGGGGRLGRTGRRSRRLARSRRCPCGLGARRGSAGVRGIACGPHRRCARVAGCRGGIERRRRGGGGRVGRGSLRCGGSCRVPPQPRRGAGQGHDHHQEDGNPQRSWGALGSR